MRVTDFASLPFLEEFLQGICLIWGGVLINQDDFVPIIGLLVRALGKMKQDSARNIHTSNVSRLNIVSDKSPAWAYIGVCPLARTMISTRAGVTPTIRAMATTVPPTGPHTRQGDVARARRRFCCRVEVW
jgi:hypothetical protein